MRPGDTVSLLKYDGLIDIDVNIVEGEDLIKESSSDDTVTALEQGTAKIHISYTDEISKDVTIHINPYEDQTLGTGYEGTASGGASCILDSNGTLWTTSPEFKKLQTGVKQYISDRVFETKNPYAGSVTYRNLNYYVDNNNVLWSEDNQKIAEDIVEAGQGGALDSKGNFYDLHAESPEPISNVVKWASEPGFTLILKSDGIVWERNLFKWEQTFTKISDDAVDISAWKSQYTSVDDGAYLKSDGTVVKIQYFTDRCDTEIYNVNAVAFGAYQPSYYDESGNYYLLEDNVCVGNIKVADIFLYDGSEESFYLILAEDGTLYFADDLGDDLTKIASDVAVLSNESGSWHFKDRAGQYYIAKSDKTVEKMTEVRIKKDGDYRLYNTYNGREQALVKYGIVLLDCVTDFWKNQDNNNVYALRTDGSVWNVTNSPVKLGTVNETKEPEPEPDKVSYKLENGVLTISGKGAMDSYGKAASQPWYQDRTKITSVVVEDGVTEIGNFAFYGLTNMKSITISDSVTKIGAYAFKNCTALTDIQLPKSLETIGDSAFYSCTGLTSVTFPENVTFIDGYAFARCTGIKQITFEGDAPEIKAGAFSGVKADVDYSKENATWTDDKKQNYGGQLTWEKSEPWELKDHVLTINDDSVMNDYDSAKKTPWYANRDEITSIVVSDGVTKVGAFAFYGLSNLTSVTLSDTVASIGGYAFKNCVKLTDINLPTGMKKIGESAFYGCSSLKSITIPEGLYTIWAYTFKNCTSLSEVNLPSTLIKIDEAAFYGCTSLEKLEIPDNVSIIGIYCFKNCTKLSDVQLPKKLTQIREAAFYSCTSLTNVTVPEKVESIGNYAFRRCEGLKTIILPETLKTIGESSFYGCSNLSEFALPEGLTGLGDYAFKNCIKVKEINLPALLTTIGASTFYGCTGLTSITIPEKVTAIGAYAFSSCSNLKEVLFTGDAPEIGAYAFSRITANVGYPSGNSTWTVEKRQNYGGTLTWVEVK